MIPPRRAPSEAWRVFLVGAVLFVQPDGSLGNVPTLGRVAIALALLLSLLLFRVERGVRQRVPPPDARPEALPRGMATAPQKV